MGWPLKCPECGSSKIFTTALTFKCDRCGYGNDKRPRGAEFRRYKKKEDTIISQKCLLRIDDTNP